MRIKNLECNSADNIVDLPPGYVQPRGPRWGSRGGLATSSRVDEATTTPLTLLDRPLELILCIAYQLEVRDLSVLRKVRFKLEKKTNPHRFTRQRQSNGFIYSVTRGKLLWGGMLPNFRLPLPRALDPRFHHLDDLSYPELEKAVLHSHMTELRWLKRRKKEILIPVLEALRALGLFQVRLNKWLDNMRCT